MFDITETLERLQNDRQFLSTVVLTMFFLAIFPIYFSNAGGSGDGMFGDFSRIYFASFGPTSILVDPYSAATENAVRLVVNQHYDWKVASGASFVKYTSLLS